MKLQPRYIHRLYHAAKALAVTLRTMTGPELNGLLMLEEQELESLQKALEEYEKRTL